MKWDWVYPTVAGITKILECLECSADITTSTKYRSVIVEDRPNCFRILQKTLQSLTIYCGWRTVAIADCKLTILYAPYLKYVKTLTVHLTNEQQKDKYSLIIIIYTNNAENEKYILLNIPVVQSLENNLSSFLCDTEWIDWYLPLAIL